jgi:hypothetical protein
MARRVLVNGRLSLATRLRWVAGGVASVLRADVHGTWSWRDPLPTLVTWARLLTRFTGRELTPRGVPRSRVDD